MQNHFNGGSPGNRAKVSIIYGWFTMEYGQLSGALNTKTTAPLKLPFARLSSGQQPRKEEATCENGKPATEWTVSAKASQESPNVIGQRPERVHSCLLSFRPRCPKGQVLMRIRLPERGDAWLHQKAHSKPSCLYHPLRSCQTSSSYYPLHIP